MKDPISNPSGFYKAFLSRHDQPKQFYQIYMGPEACHLTALISLEDFNLTCSSAMLDLKPRKDYSGTMWLQL